MRSFPKITATFPPVAILLFPFSAAGFPVIFEASAANSSRSEALAETLGLNVVGYFDEATKIGRICKSNHTFEGLENIILDNFGDARVVNCPDDFEEIEKVGIISGFGLKNPNYIKLADQNNLDVLISGDLTQETAILAKNLHLTLIDLGHHESEVPGLCRLAEVFNSLDVECEVIDKKPIERLL